MKRLVGFQFHTRKSLGNTRLEGHVPALSESLFSQDKQKEVLKLYSDLNASKGINYLNKLNQKLHLLASGLR